MMMAAMAFIVFPLATMEQRPWQIAVTAAIAGMVFGEHGAWLRQDELERRKQSGTYQPPRHPKTSLMVSSVTFTVLLAAVIFAMWDRGMMFPGTAPGVAGTVALVIACGIAGLLWYWLMGWWYRDYFGLDREYRPRS
jgi:hypothetical protein